MTSRATHNGWVADGLASKMTIGTDYQMYKTNRISSGWQNIHLNPDDNGDSEVRYAEWNNYNRVAFG